MNYIQYKILFFMVFSILLIFFYLNNNDAKVSRVLEAEKGFYAKNEKMKSSVEKKNNKPTYSDETLCNTCTDKKYRSPPIDHNIAIPNPKEVVDTKVSANDKISKKDVGKDDYSNKNSSIQIHEKTKIPTEVYYKSGFPEVVEDLRYPENPSAELINELMTSSSDIEPVSRSQTASSILEVFSSTSDPVVHEKLFAINQPESLSEISILSLQQGDKESYTKAINQIESNPSEYTFDALLALSKSEYSYYAYQDDFKPLEEVASEWAYQQLSGSRIDFIEKKLEENAFSEQEKELILVMLQSSEDQERGHDLIKRFFGE